MGHPDGEDSPRALGRLDDTGRSLGSERQGPLDQDVLSRFERRDRVCLMVPIGRAQDDGIQFVDVDQFLGIHDQRDVEAP